MGLWKAKATCYVQGVLLEGEAIIELTDEQEKEEGLGKYAKEVPDQKAIKLDPKSNKTVKIGNKNLVKVSRSSVDGVEGKPFEEGMILYPPAKARTQTGQVSGDVHPTQFQTVR